MMKEIADIEIEVRVNPAYVRQSEVRTLVGSQEKLHALVGDVKAFSMEETLRWMVETDVDRPHV
jgi:GDP-D-mannose dehydratase